MVDSKRGQVAIFVIIAIVIIAGVVVFFAVRGGFGIESIDPEFQPIYTAYSSCIEESAVRGLDILGTQGGRIDTGDYVPGSEHAPFSSHLNFMGAPIGYWYYISGNNLVSEKVPTRNEMEEEVANFIADEIANCNLGEFYEQGFYVELDNDPKVDVNILDEEVRVDVGASIVSSRGEGSARKTNHEVVVGSKVGSFYETALEIYNKQIEEAFLENYAVDVLRNYAPVDGVEISCGPEIWKTNEVVSELHKGLESNIGAIKLRGNYYELDDESDNYFVVDHNVDENVNFLYSSNWPSKTEVSPADQELMIAEPVGNRQGVGAMGFCYVPYHFVYDVSFPVLIQVSDGLELFQFPVAVIIDNNVPREAILMSVEEDEEFNICQFNEGNVEVRTYNVNLDPVEADISYKCFDNTCDLGSAEFNGGKAVYSGGIPQCVNGYLIAQAEGYTNKKVLFSSNSESFAEIILDREYDVLVEVKINGQIQDSAIINFRGEDNFATAVLPESNSVKLSEGSYEISAQVYGDSAIRIPASTRRQCQDVPSGGISGFFGGTKEECFDIEIPATNVDYALLGGGSLETYILESELSGGKIVISVEGFNTPRSVEDLQYNYAALESSVLGVRF